MIFKFMLHMDPDNFCVCMLPRRKYPGPKNTLSTTYCCFQEKKREGGLEWKLLPGACAFLKDIECASQFYKLFYLDDRMMSTSPGHCAAEGRSSPLCSRSVVPGGRGSNRW